MKTPFNSQAKGSSGSDSARGLRLLTLLLLLGFIIPGFVPAGLEAAPPAASTEAEPGTGQVEVIIQGQEPIIILADRIEHDENLDLTHFSGRVSLRRGLETLTADRAVWHNQSGTAEVMGSARLEAPDFWIEAERAAVNLELSLAKVYQGRAFFTQGHYYLNGTVIERLNEKEWELIEASATTCDGPTPPWTIQAEHLTVTEGGYASATGVVIKGVGSALPFLATPYFFFPVKTDRQSGFLKPSLAFSSKDGLTASLPLFWAAAENYDFTYTPVWRENRGLSSTLEGRYHLTWGRGLWQISHLNDQADRYYKSYSYRGSKEYNDKAAEQRFWLRAQNQGRAGDWDLNLNLDLASDPLYLREFTLAPDGFDQSHKAFYSSFGHAFNEALNPNRANELYAQKLDGSTQTRAGLYYTQDLDIEGNRNTLQRLPSLQYDLVGRSLDEMLTSDHLSPRFSFNTRYDHFYRRTNEKSDNTETGHRLRFQPTVDWARPLGLANLRMTGDLEMAAYAAGGRRPWKPGGRGQAEHERWNNLLAGSGEVELATTVSRVFEGGPGQAVATRHQITPTLAFKYVGARENQGRLPFWDHHDRRLPRQTFRYGLSNNLVAKTTNQPENKPENQLDNQAVKPPAAPVDNYSQFLKFGLWSSYELADNSRLTSQPSDRYYDTDYYGQGSGPLEASLEAFFAPHVSTRLVSTFNTRTGKATSHDLSLNLADSRGDRLTLAYDFREDQEARFLPINTPKLQEARANLDLRLNSEWSTNFSTRYNLMDNRALESTAQLHYQAQCYGMSLIYAKTYNEQSVGLVIDLMGLGSIDFRGAD